MSGRVHVLGAGLAGLAAALSLSKAGRAVVIHDMAPAAGGRCRSFYDGPLGQVIDNGNHLMMSANSCVFDYLDEVGTRDLVDEIRPAAYPFHDLKTGERWTWRPNRGPIPWWILQPSNRVPGARLRDYLAAWRLLTAGPGDTIADRLATDTVLWQRFWEPLSTGALNCGPEEGAARLLAAVYDRTFRKGEAFSRPVLANRPLSEVFVAPALQVLADRGAVFRPRERVRAVETADDRATAFHTSSGEIGLDCVGDAILLALPAWQVSELLPEIPTPQGTRAIYNMHFRHETPPGTPRFVGLVNSHAQWIFVKDDIISLTISNADHLISTTSQDQLHRVMWKEVAAALSLPDATPPPGRSLIEKRATVLQTPENERRRPGTVTRWRNLYLAGDWTDMGLPATIEGAIQSGRTAATALLSG